MTRRRKHEGIKIINRNLRWWFITVGVAAAVPLLGILTLFDFELFGTASRDYGTLVMAITKFTISAAAPTPLAGLLRDEQHGTKTCAQVLGMPTIVMPQYVKYKETAYRLPSVREVQGVFWETPKDVVAGDRYKCDGDMTFSMIESMWQKEGAESLRNLPVQVLTSAVDNIRQVYKVGHSFVFLV